MPLRLAYCTWTLVLYQTAFHSRAVWVDASICLPTGLLVQPSEYVRSNQVARVQLARKKALIGPFIECK